VLYFKDRKQVEIHLFNCLTPRIAVIKLFLKCTKRLMTKYYEKESYVMTCIFILTSYKHTKSSLR